MLKKYTSFKVAAAFFLAAGIGGVFYYVTQPADCVTISNFDPERDSVEIHTIMKENWYWLIESGDFSVDHMLKNRAPNSKNPQYFGKLIIKVLRVKDTFAGFNAYYKKNVATGQILFIAVKNKFRGCGYGLKLVNYAVNALARMGVMRIQLVTRTSNLTAQKIYNDAGFEKIDEIPGFVYFQKSIK